MNRTVKAVQADLVAARQGQAEASANAERFKSSARVSADNAAQFARWSGKATREAERLAVFQEREVALLTELSGAQKREAIAAYEGEVAAHNAEAKALGGELKRDYPKLAAQIANLCERSAASDRRGAQLRAKGKELGSSVYPGPDAESIARPSRTEKRRELYGLKPDADISQGITPDMMAESRTVEHRIHFPALRDTVSLPDFEGGKPLWSGSLLKY